MKVICKENHWTIKDGQVILDTPEGQEVARKMIKELEKVIRTQIHNEIAELTFTDNRKQIMKHGLENCLLMVQDICAKVALGDQK
jgi:hypothetical protein